MSCSAGCFKNKAVVFSAINHCGDSWHWSALRKFVRDRKLVRKNHDTMIFIWCNCCYYDCIGFPCVCIFKLLDDTSLNYLPICHCNVNDGHYGNNTKLGFLMIQAQVFPLINILATCFCNNNHQYLCFISGGTLLL